MGQKLKETTRQQEILFSYQNRFYARRMVLAEEERRLKVQWADTETGEIAYEVLSRAIEQAWLGQDKPDLTPQAREWMVKRIERQVEKEKRKKRKQRRRLKVKDFPCVVKNCRGKTSASGSPCNECLGALSRLRSCRGIPRGWDRKVLGWVKTFIKNHPELSSSQAGKLFWSEKWPKLQNRVPKR